MYSIYIYIYIYIYIHLVSINVGVNISGLPSFASIQHRNAIIFDMRRTLCLIEPPAKLLKTYLKDSGNICFVVI